MGRKLKVVFVCVLVVYTCCCCVECHGGGGGGDSLLHGPARRVMVSILLGSISGCGCALLCACLLSFIFRYMRRAPILKGPVVFSPQISPKSLQAALLLQNDLSTSSSDDGKTVLDNGFTVAVKKLPSSQNNRRRVQRELQILAALRHRHLLSLMAYYYCSVVVGDNSRCFYYLVYEYVPTGSLEDAIRRRRQQMGWDARLRIAVGIIKALHHLHFNSTPPLLHYDLKPSNVLLDADFEPRLALSALANTFHGLRSPQPPAPYYAPECFPNFSIYTEKSDIFSFGVILGMLLTGRDPTDPLFGEVTSSGRGGMGVWFRQVLEAGDGREALDKSLLGEEMEEDEMLMAVRIAAVCLSDMPLDRPSSDELVPMLTQLHSF
ncbi:putative transferase, protein kinase RLK-Pelle-LRR-XI-1 family [Helianthus debilis subsp. tardiflorus]